MSLPIDRDFVIQAFIVVCVCVGGSMFLVKPGDKELRELDAVIAAQRDIAGSMSHANVEEIANSAPVIRKRAGEIYAAGHFSTDSSALYGRITALAKQHGVKVENLRPGDEQQRGKEGRTFAVTRVDMTVVGEYERIAMFLASMDEIDAYLRRVSVQIAPSRGQVGSMTVMQLGFEAIRFDLPESLMAFVEKDQ